MTALKYNFDLDQGGTFSRTFKWLDAKGDPKDLNGWLGRMQIRSSYLGTPFVDLTTENEKILLSDSYIRIIMDEGDSSSLPFTIDPSKNIPNPTVQFYYDLFLSTPIGYTPHKSIKFMRGIITLYGSITR